MSDSGCLEVQIHQREPVFIDVTLQCKPGELLALVGPSGSGKSTVLRSIAGLNHPEHALIRCNGELWDHSPTGVRLTSQQRKAGMVFQEYALFPHKSALENVMLATPGQSRQERVHKALAILERTNMQGLENRMPSTLSGGQKQRVAIARALAREPRVLLLDEPFSAVDQQTRRKLYRELAALRQSLELPIILVTHDLTEVQLLADSLCLMHHGASFKQGPVSSIINQPASREIARLVGHQNLFTATVVAIEENHTVYRIGEQATVKGPVLPDAMVGTQACLLIAPSGIQIASELAGPIEKNTEEHHDVLILSGLVHESVVLGDELSIRLHLENIPKSLRFRIALHRAMEKNIRQGSRLDVSIQGHRIHVMAQ